MKKFIITLTDRSIWMELDLRKNKLSSRLEEINVFKIDQDGNVTNKNFVSKCYGLDRLVYFIEGLLKDDLPKNIESSGWSSNYMTKEHFNTFVKFAKKNGKVFEFDSFDNSILEVLEKGKSELSDKLKEINNLEKTFPSITFLDKKGRYRKIDYKNIIIYSETNSYHSNTIHVSNQNTYITHKVSTGRLLDTNLEEEDIKYYGFYYFGKTTKILKAGKKGTVKFLELYSEYNKLRKNVLNEISNYYLDMFEFKL